MRGFRVTRYTVISPSTEEDVFIFGHSNIKDFASGVVLFAMVHHFLNNKTRSGRIERLFA